MVKRLSLLLVLSLLLTVMVGGLATAQDEVTVFSGGWPYQVPPDGHFNTYATGAINLGIYVDLMLPPLTVYLWADASYDPMMAESFGFTEDGNSVVTLRDGVTWSDGAPVTSADLVATFNTGYLINWPIWADMASVEAIEIGRASCRERV